MRTTLSIILVTALAATSAFAAKRPYYGGSTAQKSYQAPSNPTKPKVSEADKKMAEEEGLDIRKMTQQLQNGAKK